MSGTGRDYGQSWRDQPVSSVWDQAARPAAVTVTLALQGLPVACPHCGHVPGDGWPLTVVGHVLKVTCPACWTVVAPVRAVAAQDTSSEGEAAL